MTPFDDFVYLVNSILLGEEPTIEDFILLIGTLVAFVAFILWCCFPIVPRDPSAPAPTHYDHYYSTAGSRRANEEKIYTISNSSKNWNG
ncbi:uncharacterized protein LOC108670226 [Hyalella azteca]|uniref:Uncharacterized protein LOC108670226 n=1 Tax=Hyalella azteca TaxID=294128 RepID=A0A8B7NIJ5_HYAAZ|nr:uncharacterized protein LOC108670226 [Hyalella azteca]